VPSRIHITRKLVSTGQSGERSQDGVLENPDTFQEQFLKDKIEIEFTSFEILCIQYVFCGLNWNDMILNLSEKICL